MFTNAPFPFPAGAKSQVVSASVRVDLPPQLPDTRVGAPGLPPGQHAPPWGRLHSLLQVSSQIRYKKETVRRTNTFFFQVLPE